MIVGDRILCSSPHDGSVLGEVSAVTPAEVTARATTARAAGKVWAAQSAATRAEMLTNCAEALGRERRRLATLVTREVGKPSGEAEGEITRGIAILRYHAQTALLATGETFGGPAPASLSFALRQPRGVAALITPWNFPIAIPLWKAAPALACGNSVLLKPAPQATATALALVEVLEPELPEGILQILPGGVDTAQAAVSASDVVSFTGSTAAGSEVRRSAVEAGLPVQCEMGGQNASLVLADANLPEAAAMIARAAMGFAGQKCTATRRVVVVGDHEEFARLLADEVDRLPFGDPADPATVVGPLIDEAAAERVSQVAREAVTVLGGRCLTARDPDQRGNYVAPQVMVGVEAGPLLTEEVFGPAVTVHPARDAADAVAKANAVRAGLVASIFTGHVSSVMSAVQELEVGLVRVNAPTTGLDLNVPFGGTKSSSYGPPEQGLVARDFFTRWQTVLIQG